MKRLYAILMLMLVGIIVSYGQSKISGKVISSSDNLGLPGVTVMVKGQSVGTITDFDGNYSLDLPENATIIVFSFIGMQTQEIALTGQTEINITLEEETELLEDVVVTALGIKRDKKSLGYAVQEVSSDEVRESGEANIVNALNAKVAGVNIVSSSGSPGASANIAIRGRTSLEGNNAPLFIVDGIPMDNSFEGSSTTDQSNRAVDLNADDIESVSVLKGPAAAALYGIRAGNGAIIITTKKGKKGVKSTIELKSSISFDQVNKLPEKQKIYTQGSYIGGVPTYYGPESNSGNGIATSWGPKYTDLRYDGDSDFIYDKNGRLVPIDDPNATSKIPSAYDNAENFFRTGVTYNNHLSMSAGNEKMSYYMSVGNMKQNGIIPLSDFQRTSSKLSGSADLNDKLSLTSSISYINSGGNRSQRGSNASGVMFGLMRGPESFDNSYGIDDPVDNRESYRFADGTQRTFYYDADNPYWTINMNRVRDRVNRVMGFAQANYKITNWINATYRVGIDNYSEEISNSLANFSADNYFVGIMKNNNKIFNGINSDFIISAQRDITEDIEVSTLIGHSYQRERSSYLDIRGEQFMMQDFYDMSNVELVTDADNYISNYAIAGAFYEFKVNYKSFLFLGTTGRNDWSSTLPKESNSFFYPAVNAGFIFTELFGLKDSPIFPYGKLRANFAKVGNDAPTYTLKNYYVQGGTVRGRTTFGPDSQLGNLDLKPEETQSWEIGTDLRFLSNRYGVDFTYYSSVSNQQIVAVTVPYSSGFSSQFINAGKISNKGIELQLTGTPVEIGDFSWDFLINFTKSKNMVEELADNLDLLESSHVYGVTSTQSVFIVGQPYAVIYGSVWERNGNGDVVVRDNGMPVEGDRAIVGDPNPDWTMGIRNSLNYKGLSVSALLDIRKGGDIFNGTVAVMKSLGTHESTLNRDETFLFEGVYQDGSTDEDGNDISGQPNKTPISYYDFYSSYGRTGISEENIEDGSWIRLRDVNIMYSLPKAITEKVGISKLQIGLSGRNLLLFTNYSGIDPETNLSGASNSIGRDYFNNPNTKSYSINLKLTF